MPMNATGQFPALDRPWLLHRRTSPHHPHHDLFLFAYSTGGFAANNVVWRSRDGGPWQPLGDPLLAGGAPPDTITMVPPRPALAPNGDLILPLLTTTPAGYADYTAGNPSNERVQVLFARLHNPGQPDQYWQLHQVDDLPLGLGGIDAVPVGAFPVVAADGDNNLYLLLVRDITGKSKDVFDPYLWSSTDDGQNWTGPTKLNDDGRARGLPDMLAGTEAGQLMIGWYHSKNTLKQCGDDNNGNVKVVAADGSTSTEPAKWSYEVVTSTDATSATPHFQATPLEDGAIVHYGGISLGNDCNAGLRNFSSMAYDSRGCALVAYGDDFDDVTERSVAAVDNKVARQTSGCFGDVD
jgi:hypothetical protein